MNYLGYSSANENIDVSSERQRLWSIPKDQLKDANGMVLFELCKYYDKHKAVDRVSGGNQNKNIFSLKGSITLCQQWQIQFNFSAFITAFICCTRNDTYCYCLSFEQVHLLPRHQFLASKYNLPLLLQHE